MLKKYKQRKVYLSTTEDELNQYSKSNDFEYVIATIHSYLLIDEYDKMYEVLKNAYKRFNFSKYIEKLDYYQYLYFLNKKDSYNSEKLYIKTIRNKSSYIVKTDIDKCRNIDDQFEIFDREIAPYLSKRYILKEYGTMVYILYLLNFNRGDRAVYDKKMEKQIVKDIKKRLKRKRLSLSDIIFLKQVVGITDYNFSMRIKMNNNRDYIITLDILDKVIYKLMTDIQSYKGILKEKQLVDMNETVILGLRILMSLSSDVKMVEQYSTDFQHFIDNNIVTKYTKFINNITRDEKKNKDMKTEDCISFIQQILKGKVDGDILHTVFLITYSMDTIKQYNELLELLNRLDTKNATEVNTNAIILSRKLVEFWAGNKISLDFMNENMIISPFLKHLIDYDNGNIKYTDFIKTIEGINNIDYPSIFNWDRMEMIFADDNLDWFSNIVKKFPERKFDYKIKNFISKTYGEILNGHKHIFLKDFLSFHDSVMGAFVGESIYKCYSIMVFLNIYGLYDKTVNILIGQSLKDYQNINLSEENLLNYLYCIVSNMVNSDCVSYIDDLKEIIEEKTKNEDKYLLLYAIAIYNKTLLDELYEQIINNIFYLFNNMDKITQLEYMIISLIANKLLIEKNDIYFPSNDIVYHKENEIIVLKNEYNEDYKKIYDELKVVIKETVSVGSQRDSLLYILTCRIFFANVEKFGVGKTLSIPENSTGKEIMQEMLDFIGYDEEQENIQKIKKGEIIQSMWLNEYNLHQFLKDIKSSNDYKFKNSRNNLVIGNKKIIHPTSVILLSKIGLLGSIVNNEKYVCLGNLYDEIAKMKSFGTVDFIDGVIEDRVCYDDLLEDIYDNLKKMEDIGRIEYISNANITGIKEIERMNKYDREFFKYIVQHNEEITFLFITEDTFYYNNELFNRISYGTYTLLIDLYANGNISGKSLLEATEKLEALNYNLAVQNDIYKYLVQKGEDAYIDRVITVLNKYN